jgi:hypothetical protein
LVTELLTFLWEAGLRRCWVCKKRLLDKENESTNWIWKV